MQLGRRARTIAELARAAPARLVIEPAVRVVAVQQLQHRERPLHDRIVGRASVRLRRRGERVRPALPFLQRIRARELRN
ncbi:hypothetical protein [Burkholderia savannae]|uniref:hypothetical protein n=1 Tax=Burkholderia savannae TaxID=1637837 RepID=UPI001E4FFF35|nr:hypothetical protein [Burkholderia savannae]